VSKNDSFSITMALIAHFDEELNQMNMKTIFLNKDLEDEVYMTRPGGFDDDSEKTCKLSKSIYGLKHVFHQWYINFTRLLPYMI
jgi:hypothetical protein